MDFSRKRRSPTSLWQRPRRATPRRLALIPLTEEMPAGTFVMAGLIWFVLFAIAVIFFQSRSSHEAIAMPPGGYDDGGRFSRRFVSAGASPQETVLPTDSLRDPRTVLGTAVTIAMNRMTTFSLAIDERDRQLSLRGSMKAVSTEGWGSGLFGRQAMFLGEGARSPTNADLWSNFDGTPWGLPNGWHRAAFQDSRAWEPKFAITSCPGPSCPDLTAAAGQITQKGSPDNQDSPLIEASETPVGGSSVDRPTAQERWMRITYDPSPPSVAPPVLGLLCDSRLPATPSSFLLACDSIATGTGSWGLSLLYDALEAELYSDWWSLGLDVGSGFQVVVSNALPNLLDQFGVDQIRTTQAREGLQAIGKSASDKVLKDTIMTPDTDFFAGITSHGPGSAYLVGVTSQGLAAGYEITSGQFGAQVIAFTAGGQVQIAGALIYQSGDLGFGYSWSPDGGALIGRYKRDAFDLAIALAGSDVRVGLSYAPKVGPTVQASWSGAKGFEIAIAASFKLDTTGHGPMFELFDSGSSMELPLGPSPSRLSLSPPSPSDGPSSPYVDFTWSPPAAAPATPPTPSSGTGATLVVRACVVAEGVETCRPEDPILPLRILVDGTAMTSNVGEIPVSPGHHLVVIPVEAVPQGLAPLRGLSCDLTVPLSTVGTCELPFRREGGPFVKVPED